jgi:hypothetical protein
MAGHTRTDACAWPVAFRAPFQGLGNCGGLNFLTQAVGP